MFVSLAKVVVVVAVVVAVEVILAVSCWSAAGVDGDVDI